MVQNEIPGSQKKLSASHTPKENKAKKK